MNRRLIGFVGALCASSMVLAACSSDGSESSENTVLIGAITSTTGTYSVCAPAYEVLDIAMQEVNAAGGIEVGSSTYKFELKSIDDQSEVARDTSAAAELIQGGANFIFGPCGAGAASTVQLAQPEKVVVVSTASSAASQIEPGGERAYVLTGVPSTDNRVQAGINAIETFEPEARRLVIFGPEDPTWDAVTASVKKLWTASGGEFTAVSYPVGTSNLGPFLAKAKSSNPDVMWVGESPLTVSSTLKQLDASGMDKDLVLVGHASEADLAPQASGRPYIALPFSPDPLTGPDANQTTKDLVEKYLETTGTSELPAYSPPIRYFYDIFYMLAEAMSAAGSVSDTDKILDALEDGKIVRDGALGRVVFDADGFVVYPQQAIYVAPDGSQTTSTYEAEL